MRNKIPESESVLRRRIIVECEKQLKFELLKSRLRKKIIYLTQKSDPKKTINFEENTEEKFVK